MFGFCRYLSLLSKLFSPPKNACEKVGKSAKTNFDILRRISNYAVLYYGDETIFTNKVAVTEKTNKVASPYKRTCISGF